MCGFLLFEIPFDFQLPCPTFSTEVTFSIYAPYHCYLYVFSPFAKLEIQQQHGLSNSYEQRIVCKILRKPEAAGEIVFFTWQIM